jgi:ubiquinone/menaquinone biosynthesis C-methylase UbiE
MQKRFDKPGEKNTSWQKVSKWYSSIVGEKGHYYHQAVVIPNSLNLLNLKQGDKLLDVACGQGVFSRSIPETVQYTGVDVSKSLVDEARRMDKNSNHKYFVADVTKNVSTRDRYNKAVMILALQNIKEPEKAINYVVERLEKDSRFLIVINHPCFRIPRQSSWETDSVNKMQYRRVNRYLTELEIPINAHPGEQGSPVTWSFHHSIEDYSAYLNKNGFLIEKIEEWTSDKKSEGSAAKMENRSREEFPMFMAILAVKK